MDIKDCSKGIYHKLKEYAKSDYYPFHMPGHKRRNMEFINPYEIDITEIEGFDDLHHPEPDGLLTLAQQEAADIYAAKKSFFLVNGSSAGILAAICASVKKDGTLLMAKNCHKSAYHATYLREINTQYLLPDWMEGWECFGQVRPEALEEKLKSTKNIQAFIMVSPTYEGVISDIESIAKICHKYQVLLIVDEAHGAHLNFGLQWSKSALEYGADIVIQSLHKTLPSLTQTAILHVGSDLVDCDKIKFFLDIFQSSSPSYILMASIQECIRLMNEKGTELFNVYWNNLQELRTKLRRLKNLKLLEKDCFDDSKIVIGTFGIGWNARKLYEKLLTDYHLQAEMATENYVILMTTVNDSKEGFNRLADALYQIDNKFIGYDKKEQKKSFDFSDCIGKKSVSYIYTYPPGIPILVPGEKITKESIEKIQKYLDSEIKVHGLTEDGKIQWEEFIF